MNWSITNLTQEKALVSFVVIILIWLLRFITLRLINKRLHSMRVRYLAKQVATYTALMLTLVLLVRLWFEWVQSLLTLLGVVAAALTIVSKELIQNFVSYSVIIWRSLFDVGERIHVNNTTGEVLEIGPMYISIAEIGQEKNHHLPTGRIIKIPNSQVLTHPVTNFSRGADVVWNEFALELPLSSNWRKAKTIVEEVSQTLAYKPSAVEMKRLREENADLMFLESDPSTWVKPSKDFIQVSLRYPCRSKQRAQTEHKLYQTILERFEEEVDIHYPNKPEKTKDHTDSNSENGQ